MMFRLATNSFFYGMILMNIGICFYNLSIHEWEKVILGCILCTVILVLDFFFQKVFGIKK
jgi:hypothetical protein